VSLTITHTKTNTIPDWDQQKLDAAISAGLYPQGTRLADIVLPSDWNASHAVGELSLTSCTFANLPSPASSYTGQQRIVNDCNNSVWISNGTAWKPVGGFFLWDVSADPRAIAPSGTIGTGSSGQLVLGTSLDRAYPSGGYIYLPTIATTPAITAGWYWFTCAISSTLTLYASKGGAAINFTGGSAYTGVTTYVDFYTSPTIPAGMWGSMGGFECTYNFAVNSSASAKQPYFVLGGSIGLGASNLTTVTGGSGCRWNVRNTQAQARQSYTANPNASSALQGTAVSVVDMTAAQNFSFGFLRGTASDMAVLHDMEVKCFVN
jgi:hypothetical protein